MMRRAIDEPTQRARLSAALTIFGCFNVVIVWKSIEWFRNNHPGPVISFRTGGGKMDPAMEHMLFLNFLALLVVASVLILVRSRQESTAREIDSLRRAAHV
jgi:heme exporter protein C